jgi:hypothetical protein
MDFHCGLAGTVVKRLSFSLLEGSHWIAARWPARRQTTSCLPTNHHFVFASPGLQGSRHADCFFRMTAFVFSVAIKIIGCLRIAVT